MSKPRQPPSERTPAVPPRAGQKGRAGRPVGPPRRSPSDMRGHQARQAQQRRNRWIAGAAVAAVVVIVAALIGVKVAGGGSGHSSTSTTAAGAAAAAARQPVPPAAMAKLTTVPLTSLVAGAGKVSNLTAAQPSSGPLLTSGGKPQMLYIGAEFCPVCATERWAMVVALSHFGTFSDLSETHSAVTDGDIPTLSFYGSTFTSPYLTFTPVETTTNQPSGNYYVTLQTPTASELAIWRSKQGQNLSFPFIDIGNRWVLSTSQFSPTILEGQTFDSIMSAVGDNSTTIGANINASAAALVKYICTMTGQKPAATCQAVANVAVPGTSSSGASSPAK